jgi:hypothetical protein
LFFGVTVVSCPADITYSDEGKREKKKTKEKLKWENDGPNEKKNAFGSLVHSVYCRPAELPLYVTSPLNLWRHAIIHRHGDVCVYSSSSDGRTGFILFYFTTDLYMRVQLEDICNQVCVCVSSEDVLAHIKTITLVGWPISSSSLSLVTAYILHLILAHLSSLSPRSGPGRPAGMDAHSGTFSDFFFSRRTKGDHPHRGQRIDSPPPPFKK